MLDHVLENVLISVCAANLLATVVLLINKRLNAKPLQKDLAIKTFVDEGIALAEQSAKLNQGNGARLTSQDKARIAIDWARGRMATHKLPTDDSELRKFVEIRLSNLKGK